MVTSYGFHHIFQVRWPALECGAGWFWQCLVAQDIRSLVQHHLRECGVLQSTAELTQANLWLAITPGAIANWVWPILWDVTAAVTMYAIDQGRRELDSARSGDLDPGVRLTRARTRARGAFRQGLVWAAQAITPNKKRALQLASSAQALGGRLPFLQQSPHLDDRVTLSSLVSLT